MRLRLRPVALRPVEGRLEGPRIDFEQHLAFADERALCVVLLDYVTGDLGPDLSVHVSVQHRHPFAVHRNILLDYGDDSHLGSWRRRRRVGVASAASRGREQQQQRGRKAKASV